MNRQKILTAIEKQVSAAANDETSISLVDIVTRVARMVRTEPVDPNHVATVIPIEHVATFVDGNLEPDKVDAVCRAVMFDNGVLAEIVAAVRHRHIPDGSMPALPPELVQRLIDMHPVSPVSQHDLAEMIHEPEARSRRWKSALAAVGLACVALGALWAWWPRPPVGAPIESMAQSDVSSREPAGDSIDSVDVREPATAETMAAETMASETMASETMASETMASETMAAETMAAETMAGDGQPVSESSVTSSDLAPETSGATPSETIGPSTSNGGAMTLPAAGDVSPDSVGEPSSAPETTADGDASSAPSMSLPAATAPPVSLSQVQAANVVGLLGLLDRSVDGGPFVRVMPEQTIEIGKSVSFKTLSQSRGEITSPLGGTLSMDEDSEIQVGSGTDSVSASIEVALGRIALKNFAAEKTIGLNVDGKQVAALRFGIQSLAVIESIDGGVQLRMVDVALSDVASDGDARTVLWDSAIVTAGGKIAEGKGGSAMPTWMSQSPPPLSKLVSNQIGQTGSLADGLDGQIKRLASSVRLNDDQKTEMDRLIAMRISLAGSGMFDLVASPFDAVRRSAVEAIALLPPTDPRYPALWSSVDAAIGDPIKREPILRWLQLVRTGTRPDASQIDAMIDALDDDWPPKRGLADALLRGLVTNPPPFNPQWGPEKVKVAAERYRNQISGS